MEFCRKELVQYRRLGERVLDQARRRIIDQETVPNQEKIFSLFEPLTELLKRGKAARPIEFGHMIQIQQVEGKFITDYDVFETKPVEHELVEPALERHKELFGTYPRELAADKGYYAGMPQIERLSEIVETVAISKKGNRSRRDVQGRPRRAGGGRLVK
jgi:IS5 family transposase